MTKESQVNFRETLHQILERLWDLRPPREEQNPTELIEELVKGVPLLDKTPGHSGVAVEHVGQPN